MTLRDVLFLLLSILIYATKSSAQTKLCRNYDGELMERDEFLESACKYCYQVVPQDVLTVRPNISLEESLEPQFWRNHSHPYYLSFNNASHAERWASCCDNAADCCNRMQARDGDDNNGCPMSWDYYGCWPKGVPDREQKLECPDHFWMYYSQERSPCKRYVSKMCRGNGTWTFKKVGCEPMEFQRFKPDYEPPTKSEFKVSCHRTEREDELSYEAYVQDTFAKCYDYMPGNAFKNKTKLAYSQKIGGLFNPRNTTEIFFADDEFEKWGKNSTSAVIESIQEGYVIKWIQCCQVARDCWRVMEDWSKQGYPDSYCPMTWDGWSCIKAMPPGQTFTEFCPDHVFFDTNVEALDCKRKFRKECLWDGSWYRHETRNKEFTDYTPCSGNEKARTRVLYSISLLVFSMVGIIPALIIFKVYRSLQIPRIKMHVQLLLALFLYCFSATLLKGLHTIPQTRFDPPEPGGFCKVFSLLHKYFRLASYVWMFCEGFYLHRQIAAAFSEQRKFWHFYVAGWGFPLLVISAFAIARKFKSDDKCWTTPDPVDYLLYGTSLLFLVMNLLFLCHIVYILVTKLRSVQSNEPRHFRKAVRATLVLIPLFGAHTFFVVYKPDSKGGDCLPVDIFHYLAGTFDGLQGFIVALIYCYLNNEVLNLLKNDYHRYKAVKWIGRGTQRPSRGGRWSVSTQVSAVHDHHSTQHESNGKAIGVSHLDVPLRQPLHKPNGILPITEL